MGPGRSTNPSWRQFGARFDLAAIRTIYSPPAKSHGSNFIRHPPPRSREGRDTIPEKRGSRWMTRAPPSRRGNLAWKTTSEFPELGSRSR
jgi:hypothetical protein